MASLAVNVDGLRFRNPFLIASGPPGTNANVIGRAFDEGWGGVVCKTVCLDAARIINVSPRYARLRADESSEIIGWENIELISDRSIEVWLDDFARLKDRAPDQPLIASVMEEYRPDAWAEIVGRCDAAGVDGFELNLSCPHGLPERRMGSAMGQDPAMVHEVVSWVRAATRKPVWAKLTPNVTDITAPGRAALAAGADGLTAINTVLCVMGIDLATLRPIPTVEGFSEAGGYSGKAIRPIGLRLSMELSRMIAAEHPGRSLSSAGGIETGEDAAQYMLLGASTVQVCTAVMKSGYRLIHRLTRELSMFMDLHGFANIDEFRGRSLQYFTTHADLVARQTQARAEKPGAMTNADADWRPDRFVQQSERLVSN